MSKSLKEVRGRVPNDVADAVAAIAAEERLSVSAVVARVLSRAVADGPDGLRLAAGLATAEA